MPLTISDKIFWTTFLIPHAREIAFKHSDRGHSFPGFEESAPYKLEQDAEHVAQLLEGTSSELRLEEPDERAAINLLLAASYDNFRIEARRQADTLLESYLGNNQSTSLIGRNLSRFIEDNGLG